MNLNVWVVVIVWYHNEHTQSERETQCYMRMDAHSPHRFLRSTTLFRLMLYKCVNITHTFGGDAVCYPYDIETPTKVRTFYM